MNPCQHSKFAHLLCVQIAIGIFWGALATSAIASAQGPSKHVNPFIGTDGTGHTHPGASVPFGMVAPGPDNRDRGWDYTSGYQYRDKTVLGFSNTRISGAGIPELGDVLLQPAVGARWNSGSNQFAAAMDKRSEAASPGYYTVSVPAHGVKVELTASQRVAYHRYTFGQSGVVQVVVDLQHGLVFESGSNATHNARVTQSSVDVAADRGELSGTVHARNWVEREASFVVRFGQPMLKAERLPSQDHEKAPRYLLTFELRKTRILEARVALSTVDVPGARRNLQATDGVGFDQARSQARREWDDVLGRIRIEAPARQKTTFYTALYHTMLHPSDIADVDGRVRVPGGQVTAARGGHYYSTLSLWDTFRGTHPLLTLVVPERVDGFVQTLLDHHQAQGYLPLWTAWGRETWTMIGNPSLPVIADAVAKGFTGFSREDALRAMVETSTRPRPLAPAWAQHDWSDYELYGYIPFDKISSEAVSQTLEFGIGDDAVARVATALGQTEVAAHFAKRAKGYVHLYDPQTQMMRGRDSQGRWRQPFDPLVPTSPMNNPGDYTEANAWQYTLTPALHDPQGLIGLLGGPKALEDWLDRFFTVAAPGDNKHLGQEALIGQYAHGNEPSHHIAYLYAYTHAPWKGHRRITETVNRFYSDQPNGITGNDDCGQMSAWYVLSTLGLYPVVPSSGEFVLGAPQVASAALRFPSGKTLQISASGFGKPGTYAKEVRLRGTISDATHMPYLELRKGGRLEFVMAGSPMPGRP